MTYREKLRHPLWQKKSLLILDRDGWKCCSCDSASKTLNVHHLIYAKRDPWDYPDHVLQTLCEDCHKVRQEITDRVVDALRLAIKDIPTERLERVAQGIVNNAMEAL